MHIFNILRGTLKKEKQYDQVCPCLQYGTRMHTAMGRNANRQINECGKMERRKTIIIQDIFSTSLYPLNCCCCQELSVENIRRKKKKKKGKLVSFMCLQFKDYRQSGRQIHMLKRPTSVHVIIGATSGTNPAVWTEPHTCKNPYVSLGIWPAQVSLPWVLFK